MERILNWKQNASCLVQILLIMNCCTEDRSLICSWIQFPNCKVTDSPWVLSMSCHEIWLTDCTYSSGNGRPLQIDSWAWVIHNNQITFKAHLGTYREWVTMPIKSGPGPLACWSHLSQPHPNSSQEGLTFQSLSQSCTQKMSASGQGETKVWSLLGASYFSGRYTHAQGGSSSPSESVPHHALGHAA